MSGVRKPVHEIAVERRTVLGALSNGCDDKPSLVGHLGVSRSTVDRAVRDLEWHGFVERRDGGLTASAKGRTVLAAQRRFRAGMEAIADLEPLLAHVDRAGDVPVSALEGAAAYPNDPGAAPENVATQIPPRVTGCDRVLAVSSTISSRRSKRTVYRAIVDHDVTYRVVYAVNLASFLSAWGTEDRREMTERGDYRGFVTDAEVPFSLFVFEYENDPAECALFVYDDDERLVGVVLNDSEAAVEWGREYYQALRADADEITDLF